MRASERQRKRFSIVEEEETLFVRRMSLARLELEATSKPDAKEVGAGEEEERGSSPQMERGSSPPSGVGSTFGDLEELASELFEDEFNVEVMIGTLEDSSENGM